MITVRKHINKFRSLSLIKTIGIDGISTAGCRILARDQKEGEQWSVNLGN